MEALALAAHLREVVAPVEVFGVCEHARRAVAFDERNLRRRYVGAEVDEDAGAHYRIFAGESLGAADGLA